MEVFFKVFLIIIIVKLTSGAQDLMTVDKGGSKIPAYIRELIQDFNEKDSNIHDVTILNLENESSEMILNQIVMEIPEENPVIIPKIDILLNDSFIRPTSFVIILSDIFNMVELYNKGQDCFESNYFHNTAKIIFVTKSPLTHRNVKEVSSMFNHIGALNVLIMFEFNEQLKISSFNPFLGMFADYDLTDINEIDDVYPDKLRNMFGYSYVALAFTQAPRFYRKKNGEYHGIDYKFMQTVADKQNAQLKIVYYEKHKNEFQYSKFYATTMVQRTVDMTINTATISANGYTLKTLKTVNTFDDNGYCALIPNPPRTSFIGQMLTPYDFYTWILFVITIGTCIVIWKLFNLMGNGREDSALYFMYGVVAYFLLQSIPFRNNRIIQRSLLQICIFMMFILGNAYQSLIISLISESRYGATIKTFDELLQRNYSMKVDPIFYTLMNSTDSTTVEKMQIIKTLGNDINYQQEATNNTAIVLRCDVAEYIMYAKEYDSHAIDYFYLLPDQIYTSYESFPTSKFSPYYEKLQYYSTLIFESGIRQYWKQFDKFEDIRGKIEINKITNEEYLINFDDLFGVFYLLGFGFICAILALIFEIFWHDCLRHLNYQIILKFMTKKEEPKMVVRKIQVQPMERITEEATV